MMVTSSVVLFLMFFVTSTPPAPPGAKQLNRLWALQSTQSMTFDTKDACVTVGKTITASIAKTDTVTVRGWCFAEDTGTPLTRSRPTGEPPPGGVEIEQLKAPPTR